MGAPIALWWAAEVARRLEVALEGQRISAVAAEAKLARSTLYDIVAGRTWPDLVSIQRLQYVLDARLWPDWPPRWEPPRVA